MILLIDTTTNPTAIGLYNYKFTPQNAGDLKIKIVESTPENNRKLVGIIKKFIEKESGVTHDSASGKNDRLSSVTPEYNIEAVGVINGPGTFTGVRTGVTIANAMAYALKAPLYATDTLTAQISPMISDMVSLVSASNSEVYFARFKKGKMQKGIYPVPNGRGIELVETMNLPNRLNDSDIIVGDLQEKHCGLITKQEFATKNSADRIKILLDLILCKKINPKGTPSGPAKQVLPLYIKKPNITHPRSISSRNR
ncbi:MAG: hypothetical protein PHU42_00490 [Patescibacteria group bacterium]|nr:hypothetical protein [Patescibacteria group bacterium]